jgi:predicted DsbA family dithiol-disulfide isomerase
MKIEIWSDYNCPFCYIGKVHLEKALAELNLTDKVELIYKAYQLDPTAPKIARFSTAEGLARKYAVSLEEAKAMMNNVVVKAKAIGLTYNYDLVQPTNTFDAHRVIKMASKAQAKALNAAFYEAYFTSGKNLADYEVLIQYAIEAGLKKDDVKALLHSDQLKAEVEADISEAKALKVRGVPYFRINKKSVIPGAQPISTFVDVIRDAYISEMGK